MTASANVSMFTLYVKIVLSIWLWVFNHLINFYEYV